MRYDRRDIMKHAGRLMRDGMPRAEAMRSAWAAAKAAPLSTHQKQQQAGLRAALRRYGIDADGLALRAQEAVRAIVAAVAANRPALLPAPVAREEINLTRGNDGVFRL